MLRPCPPRRPRGPVALLAALCLLAGACSTGTAGEALGRAESAPRPTAGPGEPDGEHSIESGFPAGWNPPALGWERCDVAPGAECAELDVPLDWSDPAGDTITLALARTTATGSRIGSLLTNPGGPGGSGLEYLSYEPLGPDVTSRFDVVSWDPRGVGSSTSLECGTGVTELQSLDPEPDDEAEQRALEDAAAAIARECAASDGELLPHLGTEDVARDLEAIRLALGDGPLNYLGFSYGTQIGQLYAEMFPDRIRSMVLDAIVDPALGYEELLLGQAAAFDESFERDAQTCSDVGPGRCGVPDLAAAYDELMEVLEQQPLGSGVGRVGPSELATGAILTSYGSDGWELLGPALAAALDGDGIPLRSLADSYRDFGGYTSYAAVVCIDTQPPQGHEEYADFAARAAEVSPRFGAAIANELLPCATWPAEAVGAPMEITAPGAPPILVVGNTGDAATPYDNAVAVAERLEAGVLVTADIDGHVGYGANRCIADHVHAYLVHLELPSEDPRCT